MKFTGEIGSWVAAFSALVSQIVTSRSGVGVRQRPQHHRVDDGEDRGRGAGAEPEHQHRDQREARMVANLTGGGAKGVEHGQLRARGAAPAPRGPAQLRHELDGPRAPRVGTRRCARLDDLCQGNAPWHASRRPA